jgi:hypothetical protein
VDRFRGEAEGSLFGITGYTPGAVNEFSSIAFGSAENDWEIHQIAWNFQQPGGVGGASVWGYHVFTPIAPYNPVANINPVGVYSPGLITNKAFTFGTVGAVGGSNPAFAAVRGYTPQERTLNNIVYRLTLPLEAMLQAFSPPIRVPRDVTFAFQMTIAFVGAAVPLTVSLVYNERPKR